MINLFIAIVRFCQARKKSDRLFFLLHLLIIDVNATFCPLQGVTMPIWHVNTCYIVFYFLRKVKPLMRKWTKKGENAESAMFFISTVLSRRPKDSSLRLISVNFVSFCPPPLFFLQNYWRLWFYSSGPGHRQAPGLCGRHPGGQSPVVSGGLHGQPPPCAG